MELYYLGIVVWCGLMAWVGHRKPFKHKVPTTELMRFKGNEAAAELYFQRRDALGYGARIREPQECPTDTGSN